MGTNTQRGKGWIKTIRLEGTATSALATVNANDINADNWRMSILSRI